MPIEFSNCFTAFGLLIFGAILGVLCLGVEFLVKRVFKADHLLDFVRHDNDEDGDMGSSSDIDKEHMEFVVSQQKETISRLKLELSMYQKSYKWKS